MPEYAPGFDGANANVLPKNTTKMANTLVKNGLVATTIGAAAGTSTVVNKARVKHSTSTEPERYGTRVVETEALINRNSAAADVTEMKRVFTKKRPSLTFPRDLSGNGGPAFTRT